MKFKKIGKRLMSIWLTLCMVISCVPASGVLAASDTATHGGGASPQLRASKSYTYLELYNGCEGQSPPKVLILHGDDKIVYSPGPMWDKERIAIKYNDDDTTAEKHEDPKDIQLRPGSWMVHGFYPGNNAYMNYMLLELTGVRTLTYQTQGHGELQSDRDGEVPGYMVYLNPVPEPGYEFDPDRTITIPENLEIQYFLGDYYIIMPDEDVTINAAFKSTAAQHKINISSDAQAFDKEGNEVAEAAAGDKIKIKPRDKDSFLEWYVSPSVHLDQDKTVAENSFDMPDEDVSISVRNKIMYDVRVKNDGNGTGEANPKEGVEGTQITLSATPNAGYQFKEWVVESQNVTLDEISTKADNGFKLPDDDVVVKATFEAIPETFKVNITNGTATVGGQTVDSAKKDDVVTITAEAIPGKMFESWEVVEGQGEVDLNDPKQATTFFTMPAMNVGIRAKYKDVAPEYDVKVNSGTATINGADIGSQGKAKKGDAVTIHATPPATGKAFDRWVDEKGNIPDLSNATSPNASFTMPEGAVEVTGTYKDVVVTEYSVTVTNDGNGSAMADVSQAPQGTPVKLYINGVRTGYQFKEWEVLSGGVTIINDAFTMPASDVAIKAHFEKIPPVPFNRLTSGTEINAGADIAAPENDPNAKLATVEYQDPDGKVIDIETDETFPYQAAVMGNYTKWKVVSATGTGANCALVLRAKEKMNSEIIIDGGTASVNGVEAKSATEGDLVTIIADDPPAGKVFDRWQVNSGAVVLKDAAAATTTFTMPAEPVSLTALYKDAPAAEYTVTVKNDGKGCSVRSSDSPDIEQLINQADKALYKAKCQGRNCVVGY